MKTNKKSLNVKKIKKNIAKANQAAAPLAVARVLADGRIVSPTVAPVVIDVSAVETQPTPIRTAPIAGLDTIDDMLCTTGQTWNSKYAEIHETINNWDPVTFPFARFEFVAKRWPDSQWSIIKRSDTGKEVGVPFKEKSYFVFTNKKRMEWIDVLTAGVEKAGCKLKIKTAGTLKGGERQFVSFEIEGLDKLEAGEREIRSFLSLLTGIDKQMSFTLVNSTITVCCKNTFQMANDDTGAPLYAKVKFTQNCELKIDEVPKIVESFISGNETLLKKLKHWHSIGVTVTQAEQMFAHWLGDVDKPMSTRLGNIVQRLKELHVKGKGNKGETALDAFNAATEYFTHFSAGESDDATKQIESSEIGDGARSKAEFFDYLSKAFETGETFQGICKVGETILVAYKADQVRKAQAR